MTAVVLIIDDLLVFSLLFVLLMRDYAKEHPMHLKSWSSGQTLQISLRQEDLNTMKASALL